MGPNGRGYLYRARLAFDFHLDRILTASNHGVHWTFDVFHCAELLQQRAVELHIPGRHLHMYCFIRVDMCAQWLSDTSKRMLSKWQQIRSKQLSYLLAWRLLSHLLLLRNHFGVHHGYVVDEYLSCQCLILQGDQCSLLSFVGTVQEIHCVQSNNESVVTLRLS